MVMVSPWKRALLCSGLLGAVLLMALSLRPANRALAQTPGPVVGAPASPTRVDLRKVQPGESRPRPAKPFLHPQGQAKLDEEKAAAESLGPGTGIQHAAVAAAAAGPLTPTTGTGFDGINSAESACGCYPPDGAIAVGPNHVVAAVNTAFKIWNKSGGLLAGPIALGSFFNANPNCLANDSDPSADYDAAAGRFILETLTYDSAYNSSMCIAVSLTGDPTGSWFVYAFPVTPANDLLDFPHIAIGSDAIYLAGNQFQNGSTFTGAQVYAYNKSQMYAGQPAASLSYNVGNNAAGHAADTLYPARAVGTAGTAYFTAADNCNCSSISLWKWSTPFGTSSFTLQGGVTVTAYSQPPNALQPGSRAGTINTNDTRELGAHWFNGTVYGAHTIGCNPGLGTVACVQWHQLGNLDGAPTLVQQGTLAGDGQYRFYPNLAVNSSGDMTLGYAYSSSTEYAGIRYTGRLAGDPAGTLQPEGVVKPGEASVNGGRYGDYAGEVVDPDGCTVWHFEEYAKSGYLWGTWAGSFRFTGCVAAPTPDFSIAASPASQTVTAGASTSYTATLTAVNGYSSSVNLSLSGLPVGATGTFNPTSVVPTTSGATSTLSVATSTSTPAGTYTLTITGTGTDAAATKHSTTVTLVVTAPDFSIAASPASQTVTAGASTSYTATLTAVNGYSSSVNLSVSGLPAGATPTFVPNPVTPTPSPGATSTLSVATSTSTPAGTYMLTITGTGTDTAVTKHSTSVTLVVNSASTGDFSLSASPSTQTIGRGGSTSYTVTVAPSGGFGGAVTLSVSGLPSRTSGNFSPNPTTTSTSTLTIKTNRKTPTGSYTLTITGTSGGLTHTVHVTLVVN